MIGFQLCFNNINIFFQSIDIYNNYYKLKFKAMIQPVQILPLGAGQEVGRSCIVCKIKDKTIIFDAGIHMQYTDMEKYPDFKYLCGQNNINNYVDVVIITHFHLDHCGALPYLTEYFKYNGPVYATMPTKAMIPYMLEDYRKVNTDIKKQKEKDVYLYTAIDAKAAAQKIISISLQQTITHKGIKITPYYAGHVLGAGMFLVEYEGLSVLYTGDYNSYADRHLGAASAPRLNPNIIITETTYATTIRDTKRDRERKMLKIVSQTVENGGKVLIPVFALGRAQQLSVLLQTYWNRTQNEVPVYFSAGLIQKANFYYKLFVEWENQKIKQDFLTNNLFNFKKVKPFDKSLIRADFPYVLFATPGMLHGGTSLQVFKEWCGNPKNTLIIPGYCVPGTFGNKLLNNIKKLDIDHRQYEVNMKVENISFSAHADAKGIINLIRHVNADNIVFVHGDRQKMKIFEEVVRQQLGKDVFRPANKQPVLINCLVRQQIAIKNISQIPKQPNMNGYLSHKATGNKNVQANQYVKLIEEQNLLRELNLMQQMLGCCENLIVEERIDTEFEFINEESIKQLNKGQKLKSISSKRSVNVCQREENQQQEIQHIKKEQLKKQKKQFQFEDHIGKQETGNKIKVSGQLSNVLKMLDDLRIK